MSRQRKVEALRALKERQSFRLWFHPIEQYEFYAMTRSYGIDDFCLMPAEQSAMRANTCLTHIVVCHTGPRVRVEGEVEPISPRHVDLFHAIEAL